MQKVKRGLNPYLNIMQNLVRTGNQPNCMPFLLNVTPSSRIEESDGGKFVYNDNEQVTYYCGALDNSNYIGTRCLKTSATSYSTGNKYDRPTKTDKKNEIDDSKRKK